MRLAAAPLPPLTPLQSNAEMIAFSAGETQVYCLPLPFSAAQGADEATVPFKNKKLWKIVAHLCVYALLL